MILLKRKKEEPRKIERTPKIKRTPKITEKIMDNSDAPPIGGHIPAPSKGCTSPRYRHSGGFTYVDRGICLTRCAPDICEHAKKYITINQVIFGRKGKRNEDPIREVQGEGDC